MEKARRKKLWWWCFLPVPPLITALVLFAAMLGTAIAGCVIATQTISDPSLPYYYLTTASGVSIICSFFATVTILVAVNSVQRLREAKNEDRRTERRRRRLLKRQEAIDANDEFEDDVFEEEGDDTDDTHIVITLDVVGDSHVSEWQTSQLRNPTAGGIGAFFVSIECALGTFLCILWAITVANNYHNTDQQSVFPFIVAEVVAGVMAPLLLIISGILGAVVLHYITHGKLDAHKLIPGLLYSSVRLEIGQKDNYWVIVDTFYYRLKTLKTETDSKQYHWYNACDKTRPTWYLTVIIAISILMSISYYVNVTIASTVTVDSCSTTMINTEGYTCFTQLKFRFVNCSEVSDERDLHCFKFLEYGVDSNPIDDIIQAVVLYYVTTQVFGYICMGVKILIHFSPSKLWGVAIVAVGLIMFVVGVILTVLTYIIPSQFAVLRLLQLLMVGVYVIVTGLFILQSNWWQRVPPPKDREIELVPFGRVGKRSASRSVLLSARNDRPIDDDPKKTIGAVHGAIETLVLKEVEESGISPDSKRTPSPRLEESIVVIEFQQPSLASSLVHEPKSKKAGSIEMETFQEASPTSFHPIEPSTHEETHFNASCTDKLERTSERSARLLDRKLPVRQLALQEQDSD